MNIIFLGSPSGIGKAGEDIGLFQLWVERQYALHGFAGC